MLEYHCEEFLLRMQAPGRLVSWLGPSLRGIVAKVFKDRVCRHPPQERDTRWVRCAGCPHMSGCPYGQSYEPDPPASAAEHGEAGAVRPLVLAPFFPTPETAQPGLDVPVRLLAVGGAVRYVPELLASLRVAGRSVGLGPDFVPFEVVELTSGGRQAGVLHRADLPASPDAAPGVLPRLAVGLCSPLALHFDDERGRKRTLERPQFIDLFRPALRTVARFFAAYARPVEVDFEALKAAAERVRLLDHCYEPFGQSRHSNRTHQDFSLRGIVGGAVYADVPLALLPWMVWGGRLHVGDHRVAGAGGWRVVLD